MNSYERDLMDIALARIAYNVDMAQSWHAAYLNNEINKFAVKKYWFHPKHYHHVESCNINLASWGESVCVRSVLSTFCSVNLIWEVELNLHIPNIEVKTFTRESYIHSMFIVKTGNIDLVWVNEIKDTLKYVFIEKPEVEDRCEGGWTGKYTGRGQTYHAEEEEEKEYHLKYELLKK